MANSTIRMAFLLASPMSRVSTIATVERPWFFWLATSIAPMETSEGYQTEV
jgi:hypothetical protein